MPIQQGVILCSGITVLEVGSAGSPDQKRVPGEHAVLQSERIRIVCVAGSVDDIEADAFDVEFVTIGQPH